MSRRKKHEEEIVINTGTYFVWILFILLVIVAVGLHITAMVMYDWRIAPAIKYRYVYRDKPFSHNVNEVKYGLYKISYDGGSIIQTWNTRVSRSKLKGEAAIERGNMPISGAATLASFCPAACQDAVKTRTISYQRIQTISLSLLAIMAASSAISIIGVICFFVFGQNGFLLLSLWGASGALTLSVGGYWLWETNEAFWVISNGQQFPYPSVGFAWYFLLIGGGLYLLAGLGSLILYFIDKKIEKRMLQSSMALACDNQDMFSVMGMGSPIVGPMGDPMGGHMGGPMGGPMGGHMGSPMGTPMGSPMGGPMGNPMGGFMGNPMATNIGTPLMAGIPPSKGMISQRTSVMRPRMMSNLPQSPMMPMYYKARPF